MEAVGSLCSTSPALDCVGKGDVGTGIHLLIRAFSENKGRYKLCYRSPEQNFPPGRTAFIQADILPRKSSHHHSHSGTQKPGKQAHKLPHGKH